MKPLAANLQQIALAWSEATRDSALVNGLHGGGRYCSEAVEFTLYDLGFQRPIGYLVLRPHATRLRLDDPALETPEHLRALSAVTQRFTRAPLIPLIAKGAPQ